jgi:hypothetical protein
MARMQLQLEKQLRRKSPIADVVTCLTVLVVNATLKFGVAKLYTLTCFVDTKLRPIL